MVLVQISQVQGRVPITVLQPQDQINLENYKELEQVARDAFDKGMRNIVIDLGQTPSLTSIGIRVLVIIHKMITPLDGSEHVKLARPSEPMLEMLKIAGITQFIKVYDSVEGAVKSF